MDRVKVYRRTDKKFDWHRIRGGEIVSTSGGQGYENQGDCLVMAEDLNPGCLIDVVAEVHPPPRNEDT